ncbi:hypothetical protein KC19_9G177400 [Ceratodon purpureus]|uniref:Dynein regulatory complex subunit 2 n=1 Tax=Ceratodon purpureus TaxID=3225 RepID=A0A8T0GXM8_CERPU|nr:hypothetical protein KC19_9G177400 [Ceratodon purpureus]
MAPKPEEEVPVKKQKKPLTEEEKIAKAEHAALVAEETRKKVIRDRRIAIKQAMVEEEKRSKLSMLQMHKTWRNIMREQSVQELRKDIAWMSQKHVHEVEIKDRVIRDFCKQLEESENQHQEAMSRHFIIMDNMIAMHDVRKQQMENNFQVQLDSLNQSFFSERDTMTQQHSDLKKDIAKMITLMKAYFDEELDDKRQEYEIVLEDLKNKNKEDYNVMKLQNEVKIEQMERDIDKTHHDYVQKTKGMEEEFKLLQKRDRMTSKTIEKRMQELLMFHNQTAYMKSALVIKGKQWDDANKHIFDEKWRLNAHFIKLKRSLGNYALMEHDNLKKTSTSVYEATEALKKFLVFLHKLQTLARLNGKLETEHEEIFPFNPLYVSSIPTAPLEGLDEELTKAAKDDKCYMHGNQPKAGWEVADDVIRGEPVPGKVIPKQEKRFQVEMRISFPSDDPNEGPPLPKTSTYHWSSYAVDDNGNEVAELDYLQNFQKRYNKVMLDKMALQLERRKLIAENQKLQTAMGKWLDGYTFTEKAKTRANSLMGVDRCKMKPPPPRKSTIFIKVPKKKPAPPEEE